MSIVHLFRQPSSPLAEEPRLLRVTLTDEKDIENVLLSSYLLGKVSSRIKILPDRPWIERMRHRTNPVDAHELDYKRVALIHGVPKLNDPDESTYQQNDCKEWRFIQELIGCHNIFTTSVSQLPYSVNYRGNDPRKVTFSTPEMVTSVLQAWYQNRRRGPPEVRLRPLLNGEVKRCPHF
ncbi:unnamed protein product [Echinostoma caproni]|uniref:Uncharacterized protein n=1 Tax=Echinostoma caproni TaxID=27848 RepID=A0A183AR81_9TREM|nr:unnamed protein product [Echinostoma caproni]